uniref:Helitron helicase-like domain-containing protein n=1 Tax=Ananas comosus var. bracteatus TaxID=296719 RepID=A0A6V7PZ55_ANACO|nr:unnamed protein product [Ananas comosus var. bracteatus]
MRLFGGDDGLKNVDRVIVEKLMEMFDSGNQIVKAFRMVRDRFRSGDFHPIRLRLVGMRSGDTVQYNPPSSGEIAGLIVGDLGCADRQRDIIVEHKTDGLKRISDLHPSFMAMQYPILFPYGEDGFHIRIKYNETSRIRELSRQCVTMREFYAYRIQNRPAEGTTLVRGGKLFQQYIVDAFSCVEEERLDYIRRNQGTLRTEIYKGIRDAVVAGDTDGNAIGKKIILPSSFTAGPRYMVQNYQDAIAICKHHGHPDLFITFTCNAQWLEIHSALQQIPGQKPEDRPDIVSRVFKLKLEVLMSDLKNGKYFGKSVAEQINKILLFSDVIGRIVSFGSIGYTYVGQEHTPIRNLEIEDLQLAVTLWDNFSTEIDENMVLEKETHGPVIIILAGMTVRTYRDCSYGWWYRACYECKSAIKSYADAFWCRQCGKNDQAPIPWYKLNAIVEDDTGDANFTIFGRIAQDLIRVPAQKLATADDSDRYALPPVIKNIIGKKHVFQVMVDPHNTDMGIRSFKVIKNFSSQIAPKIQKQNDGHEIEEQLLLSPPKDLHADLSEEVTPQIISHSRLLQDESRETFDMEQPRRKRLRFAEDDDGPSSSTRE